MAAAWACALEITPAKVTVVLDKSTKTRQLVEQSGYFALQVACFDQIDMVHQLAMVYSIAFLFSQFQALFSRPTDATIQTNHFTIQI